MLTNTSINFIKQDEVLLNGVIVAQGAVSASLTKHIEYDDLGEPHPIVEIKGMLETGYYIRELDTVETNRYLMTGVDVIQERYGSLNNKIIYDFNAGMFQVKFQDEDDKYRIVDLPEDNNEQN